MATLDFTQDKGFSQAFMQAYAPRNLGTEMGQLTGALGDLAKQQQQSYVAGQKALYKFQIGQLPQDYALIMDLERQNNALDRTSAIDFLRTQGSAGMDALYASSPQLGARLDQINALADATGRTPEITRMLDQQALDQLGTNGRLSAADERAATQGARAAYDARGMIMSNPAALAEILNRQQFTDARRQENQAFAASREAGNRQFIQSATQIDDAVNPAMKILGMPTGSAQGMANTTGFIQGVQTPDPSSVMNAGLSYGADLFNTNLNAAASQWLGNLNAQTAMQTGQMQMGAARTAGNQQLLGAGIGALGGIVGGGLIAF